MSINIVSQGKEHMIESEIAILSSVSHLNIIQLSLLLQHLWVSQGKEHMIESEIAILSSVSHLNIIQLSLFL